MVCRGEEMIKSEIFVPLLNANEPEARLVDIHVKDGQAVEKGLRLFTIETTKAASDIESPGDRFHPYSWQRREQCCRWETGWLSSQIRQMRKLVYQASDVQLPLPAKELRITKPARALAELLGVDLTTLPPDQLVTEEIVRQAAAATQKMDIKLATIKEAIFIDFWRWRTCQIDHGHGQAARQICHCRHSG